MSISQSELYFWFSSDVWDKKIYEEIHKKFEILGGNKNIKAAIGAGAQGMIPEFYLLLIVSASVIASGFLNAIGEDVWKHLKRALLDFKHRKHKKPEDFEQGSTKGVELVWWIHFWDRKILITLTITTASEAEKSLELLPDAIDDITSVDSGVSRLLWNGYQWDSY